ncbi:mitochondrial carrier domain-containing protein [Roridomyces roridus]|uniref:Mitochondrial carrier domain-containing protein n=1 Tax=Roridomyces roridus TaxID=1738132 RepID=A0AAD7CIZ3_9AGAR|nr:mitochondrial carrier domain-containing protein [Roridomyces roridus]
MSSFLLLLLNVPFNGVLVRYRASYHPKAAVDDGSVSPAPTFIGLARRVWQKQGFGGLTRGFFPTLLAATLLTFFWPLNEYKMYLSPSLCNSRGLLSAVISAPFYTLAIITVYRAIVTPRTLDPLNARESLHVLFSAQERKRPWTLYQIPGLLPALLGHLVIRRFILDYARRRILPLWGRYESKEHAVRYACFTLAVLLATIVLAPLEVMTTRLVLQRTMETLPPPVQAVDGEKTVEPATVTIDSDDIVVRLNDPYSGIVDCFQKIRTEEGWPVLYRMWIVTFIANWV